MRFYNLLQNKLLRVNVVNILLCTHAYLIIYVNADFLENYFGERNVSVIFSLTSVLAVIGILFLPLFIKKTGVGKFLIGSLLVDFAAVSLLAIVSLLGLSSYLILLGFFAYRTVYFIIIFLLDILLEESSVDESKTGSIRSLYLTLSNVILVLSPTIVSVLINKTGEYSIVYFISALILVPTIIAATKALSGFKEPEVNFTPLMSIKRLVHNKDLFMIYLAQFILRLFYAWMVIYVPLYLVNSVGLTWTQIGPIFTIMLLPFVLFEIPAGQLADKKLGEKELLIVGFAITAGAVCVIPTIETTSTAVWALVLFGTRLGAALVEIMTESYFFKHVNEKDTDLISIFRLNLPLTFVIAPFIAWIASYYLSLGQSFYVLALILLLGILPSIVMKDTK